jgi:hypothetical protein
MMESEFPEQLKGAFIGMERMATLQAQGSRMEWAESPFDVPTVEENPDYEYFCGSAAPGPSTPTPRKPSAPWRLSPRGGYQLRCFG